MKYFTDDEMLQKCKILAIACLGGILEGFDYSETKAQLAYWGEKRRECGYRGGFVEEFPPNTAQLGADAEQQPCDEQPGSAAPLKPDC